MSIIGWCENCHAALAEHSMDIAGAAGQDKTVSQQPAMDLHKISCLYREAAGRAASPRVAVVLVLLPRHLSLPRLREA